MDITGKVGLCIGGGGANGAFAAGALHEFNKAHVRFDAVSGCSIGGLLAGAWSVGNLDAAKDLIVQSRRSAILPHGPLGFLSWFFVCAYLVALFPFIINPPRIPGQIMWK